MKIKELAYLLLGTLGITGLMFCNMTGCTIQELNLSEIATFDASAFMQTDYFTPDNTTPLVNLLTETYALSDLEEYFQIPLSKDYAVLDNVGRTKKLFWNEVNFSFPIQCLRYNNNLHYSVYKVNEGGYYYVFWSVPFGDDMPTQSDEPENVIKVQATLYLDILPSIKLFNSVKKNYSTANDILLIDPHMEMNFMTSLVSSYSRLYDGRIVIVRYVHTTLRSLNDLVVQDIYVCDKNSVNALSAAILSADLPQKTD